MNTRFDLTEPRDWPVARQADETVSRDVDAILTWVDSYSRESLNTRRKFRLEGLRWLAWLDARHDRHHTDLLALASVADVTAYVDHLEHPTSIAPTLLVRYGLSGSPWRGAKKESSRQVTLAILSGLYEYLRRQPGDRSGAYLTHNPFAGASRRLGSTEERRAYDKAVSRPILDEVFATIELLPQGTPLERAHYWRCRWIFTLLYRLWLRRAEVAALRMGDFEPRGRSINGMRAYAVRVTGKGRKTALLPAHPALLDELAAYRRFHGLSDMPPLDDPLPAVLPLRPRKPEKPKRPRGRPRIEARTASTDVAAPPVGRMQATHTSASTVYAVVKTIFALTETRLRESGEFDPADLRALAEASPHTMRHTGVTEAVRQGMPLHIVQSIARHARGATTDGYVTRAEDEMADQMSRLV